MYSELSTSLRPFYPFYVDDQSEDLIVCKRDTMMANYMSGIVALILLIMFLFYPSPIILVPLLFATIFSFYGEAGPNKITITPASIICVTRRSLYSRKIVILKERMISMKIVTFIAKGSHIAEFNIEMANGRKQIFFRLTRHNKQELEEDSKKVSELFSKILSVPLVN